MPSYAAVDIGSNSIRMQAAEVHVSGEIEILASDREVTRLGSSVFHNGLIAEDAIKSTCLVLSRMAEVYRKLNVSGVRAVATSAVRDASNQREFIERASKAAGVGIEVISGLEEARLIHLGVQSRWPQTREKLLILDVGGGSAEFITSESGEIDQAYSRPLGAVRLTEVFLAEDPPSSIAVHQMLEFIDSRLRPVVDGIGGASFERFIGTSATAAALVSAIHQIPRNRRDEADRREVRRTDIKRLFIDLSQMKASERKRVPGIGPKRADVILAGIAVFLRSMELFDLKTLHYSAAGVRDGIVADLAARGAREQATGLSKAQEYSLEAMAGKYMVNRGNTEKVLDFCRHLFASLQIVHRLPPGYGRILEAAAYLHNTGHFISDTGHHKHSQYVVMNSDLPGFTSHERTLIALLCRFHRKGLPALRHDNFQALDSEDQRRLSLLIPLLRMAAALDASKLGRLTSIRCKPEPDGITLAVTGEGDLDAEIWAAGQAGKAFRQIYGLPFTIIRIDTTT